MDLRSLRDLEFYFADHFDTEIFPLLAEQYLLREDFQRAHKVCQIGLGHHPDHVAGLFIEARTHLAEGDLKKSEKLLRRITTLDPGHYRAHVLLAEVQMELGRADSTLRKLYSRILQMDSENERALSWLRETEEKGKPKVSAKDTAGRPSKKMAGRPTKDTAGKPSKKTAGKPSKKMAGRPSKKMAGRPSKKMAGRPSKKMAGRPSKKMAGRPSKKMAGRPSKKMAGRQAEVKTKKRKAKKRASVQRSEEKQVTTPTAAPQRSELADLHISPQIATFTLVAVLKSQKLYEQALEVLTVMSEKKGTDKERIKEERGHLLELLRRQERK